jgi:CheY-like chemotaxis protein
MAKRILVVDDSRDFVDLVQVALEQVGYEVIPVVESLAVPAVVNQQLPDVIMLDIRMPGRSGWELLDMLRTNPATRTIPVIITTGAYVGMRAHSNSDQAVYVLMKPFDIKDLLARLDSICGSGEVTEGTV